MQREQNAERSETEKRQDLSGQIRVGKLSPGEHGKTRALYEEVFSEDSRRFVDYYYWSRASENEIYAARNADGIQGMLHLNPVAVSWNGAVQKISYLVAVATRKEYRHQGIMSRLLSCSMQEMYQRLEPFAFLMPASEAIYMPFGFRRAWHWIWEEDLVKDFFQTPFGDEDTESPGKDQESGSWSGGHVIRAASSDESCGNGQDKDSFSAWLPAAECSDKELERLAYRVNETLKGKHRMFSWRSVCYYRDLQRQQEASDGELRIIFDHGPRYAVCTVREQFPPMMARIIHLEHFIRQIRSRERRKVFWQIRDAMLPGNSGWYQVTLGPEGGTIRRLESRRSAPEAEWITLDIADIPAWLGADNPFADAAVCEVV